jgi:hypothetical protein
MRYFNRSDNPNLIAGLFMLVLLAVLAPSVLPDLAGNVIDEGVRCAWLPEGEDRAVRQSLLARAVSTRLEAPFDIDVVTNNFPQPDRTLVVTITLTNRTLAPVPFLMAPNNLVIDPGGGDSGLGVSFNSSNVAIPQTGGSYPESRIHILGPRQRCVLRVQYAFNQLQGILQGTGADTVVAFYRNGSRGATTPTLDGQQTYQDQGLWTGLIVSDPYTIPISATP